MNLHDFTLTPSDRAALTADRAHPEGRGVRVAVPCSAVPEDVALVRRAGRAGTKHARVAVAIHQGGTETLAFLHPKVARYYAAALLNAADEIDGTIPLVFMPQGPDGVEPEPEAVEE